VSPRRASGASLAPDLVSFSVPRTAVAARVLLSRGASSDGEVYVVQRLPQRGGPETVLEMLCRPEGFFAFRPKEGKALWLVAKAHAVTVSVEGEADEDPDRLSAVRRVGAEMVLSEGTKLVGWASVELPPDQTRLLDYLNTSRDPFVRMWTDKSTYYINRAHIVYARPLD
jgi:hypothetical protein